jgi:superfamily II DNA or RNA helicase
MQSPTGSGKTVMAAAICEGARLKSKRLAFVVSSISLIDQTVEKLYEEGMREVGVIQADHPLANYAKPIQVCSIQTLSSRRHYPSADIVVIDECHCLHEFHKQWMADPQWGGVPFIGLSATPWTKGLGRYFQSLLVAATTQELIDRKFLSPFKVFATGRPDLSGVRVTAGEYQTNELSETMRGGCLTADIIKTWQDRWGKGKTLVFAVDRAHAQSIHERFREAGVESAYQDANTCDRDRADIKRGFQSGEIEVVCNIGTLTTGVDWDVRCLVLARPTKSEMLYTQIVGRALRTAEGKEYALILDHSNTTLELGFVTDIHHDVLDDGKSKKADTERKKPLPRPCPACESLAPKINRTCVECGYQLPLASGVIERDGMLVEIDPNTRFTKTKYETREWSMSEKKAFFAQLAGYGMNKGYKRGWSANKFREKFGTWPRFGDVEPVMPGYEVIQFIRSRNIAWAKSNRT